MHHPRATDELVLRRDAGVRKAVEQGHGTADQGVPAQKTDLTGGLQPAVGSAESTDSLLVVGVECLEQANRRISCICHRITSWARVKADVQRPADGLEVAAMFVTPRQTPCVPREPAALCTDHPVTPNDRLRGHQDGPLVLLAVVSIAAPPTRHR